jgi:imidazolonepropionase-like amidohydrolase
VIILSLLPSAKAQERVVVYRGATVLTGTKGEIADADLVVTGSKIAAVGKRGTVAIPEGAEVIDLTGRVMIPGLVDTHSHIGIYPRPQIEAHQDGNEGSGPVQPALRALDAVWPDDPGLRMALAGGVTTANIMPGSANAIGGQTLYVKLRKGGSILDLMIVPGQPSGGLKMANGENPKKAYGSKNQAPVTRMKLAALQREQFLKAQDYQRKQRAAAEAKAAGRPMPAEPDRDLGLESLVEAMAGKRVVHFHSHRADDIETVLRLKDEFGFRLVLQHGTESYKLAAELAKRQVPVSLTILDSPGGKAEVADMIEENAARLAKAGVKVAINTDDSITESRFFLRTAAWAVRGGLSEEEALRTVTQNAAEMLDLGGRIGSIEPGKDADFVVLSGRPFSVRTHVVATYVEGIKRYDRELEGTYASGGFAVEPASRRPPNAPLPSPVDAPQLPPTRPTEPFPQDAPRLAIQAGIVYPGNGPGIPNGVILIEGGRIKAVGEPTQTPIPEGTPVLVAHAATPGLIDAHTVVGVAGLLNIPADQDQDETSDPNQADLRILDSFHPEEPLLRFALEHGVTVAQATPGRVNAIAGQAGIFRTHGNSAGAMTIRFPSAMVFNLGESPKRVYPGKAPFTRMATASLVRNALVGSVNDRKKRASAKPDAIPDRNLKHEALGLVLDRKIPAMFSAQRADDLETALRIAEEFQLKAILDLGAEAYLIRDRLAAAKVPVLVHPTMQRIGTPETMHTSTRNATLLAEKQIPIAITSAFESYVPKTRVPLFEAAMASVYGLGVERAIHAVTLGPAQILEIDQDFGSLEPGKVADVVLYDGDPLEYTTHVTRVIMDGRVVHDRDTALKNPARRQVVLGPGDAECCETSW